MYTICRIDKVWKWFCFDLGHFCLLTSCWCLSIKNSHISIPQTTTSTYNNQTSFCSVWLEDGNRHVRICTCTTSCFCNCVNAWHVLYFWSQMLLALKCQEDLDRAVQALSSSAGMNNLLRVILKTPPNNHVSPSQNKDKPPKLNSKPAKSKSKARPKRSQKS